MLHAITFQQTPDCWETCGACADEELEVLEVLVAPGDRLRAYDPLVILETGKTTLEVPVPINGRVTDVVVAVGDWITTGEVLVLLESEESAPSCGEIMDA